MQNQFGPGSAGVLEMPPMCSISARPAIRAPFQSRMKSMVSDLTTQGCINGVIFARITLRVVIINAMQIIDTYSATSCHTTQTRAAHVCRCLLRRIKYIVHVYSPSLVPPPPALTYLRGSPISSGPRCGSTIFRIGRLHKLKKVGRTLAMTTAHVL